MCDPLESCRNANKGRKIGPILQLLPGCVCRVLMSVELWLLYVCKHCVTTPSPSARCQNIICWSIVSLEGTRCPVAKCPAESPSCTPGLHSVLCLSFWVCSIWPHTKGHTVHPCGWTLSTCSCFIHKSREQLGDIVVFFSFFLSLFFFSFVCCPISDLEGQIHGKFISGPTLPNYMMWINVYYSLEQQTLI